MKQRFTRGRLWVDPPFQFRLLARLGCYFLLYIFVVIQVGFAFQVMADIAANGVRDGVAGLYLEYLSKQRVLLITLVVTAPIVIYSMLRFSHRVAGPLYRCRQVMEEMAEGNAVSQFVPRQGDLMRELLESFNGLIREWNDKVWADTNAEFREKEEHVQEISH
jgi:hypothetical protein